METKRGELTNLLDGKVFTVLLLDEFEKAARSVHDRFLQLFDEGTFVNGAGEHGLLQQHAHRRHVQRGRGGVPRAGAGLRR